MRIGGRNERGSQIEGTGYCPACRAGANWQFLRGVLHNGLLHMSGEGPLIDLQTSATGVAGRDVMVAEGRLCKTDGSCSAFIARAATVIRLK